MIGWIIYFKESATYNESYINLYIKEGKKLNIDFKLVLVEDIDFGIIDNKLAFSINNKIINKENYPDFIISRAIYPLLSKQFESLGIRVFNNSLISRICNDKAKTHQYLADLEIKTVDSFFYQNKDLDRVLALLEIPKVIKAVDGHGGKQVFLYDNINKINIIKSGINKSDFIIQNKIGNKSQDLRVYVIGKEIIAAVLRTGIDSFKSNYSLGGNARLYNLSQNEISLIKKIVNFIACDFVGIDFIIDDNKELIFNEIEDVVGSRMLYQCSDINIVKLYIEYIKKEIGGIY